jgi:WD40-like Beta Propeller Repeat
MCSLFLVATTTGMSQSKINHYSAPINHPSINVSSPYISLEGNSILFVSDNAEDNVLTVFHSVKPDGVNWKEPVALPKTLNARLNFLRGFGLSPDGKQVIVSSTKGGGLGGYDLYLSDQKGAFWSDPVNVGQPVNSKENEACPSLTTDGTTMYFMRCTRMDASKAAGCRLMMTTRKSPGNPWQQPVELPPSINTGNTQTPRIMGDGESLIFSSDQMGGKGGMDLFITKRSGTTWSKPTPLDFVNTPEDDQYVSATSLGRYLVKDAPTKTATEIVEVLFPTDLKPHAVMKVEGKVQGPENLASPYVNLLDKKTNARVLTTRPTKDGAFTLYLIEGNIYNVVIDPEQDNFTFFSTEFDLTKDKISTLEKLNVVLKPVAAGDAIDLGGVQFKPLSSEMTESSKNELKKIVRLMNGAPSLKFNIEVSLYGYQKDSIQSNQDLTEVIADTVHFTVTKTSTDSLGAVTTATTDSTAVKKTFHNDRTQHQALEVVNYLIEQGVPANRIMPASRLFVAVPEERKTKVRIIARQ